MFAEIIPHTRTPRGKDFFDYAIPNELVDRIAPGILVFVPFRNRRILGLVKRTMDKSTAKRIKSIDAVSEMQLGNSEEFLEFLQFVEWFAAFYCISQPHAFKTIQFPVVQRPKNVDLTTVLPQQALPSLVVPRSAVRSIQQIGHTIIEHAGQHLVHYSNRNSCIALYRYSIHHTKGNVQIIVPEYIEIDSIVASIPDSLNTFVIHENTSSSELIAIVNAVQSAKRSVVIGTKKALFLAPYLFATRIIDQEEYRSHKQYHLNPRYHVPTVAYEMHEKCAASTAKQQRTIYTSHAPSALLYYKVQKNDLQYHDMRGEWNRNHITVVNMEDEYTKQNFTWFSELLLERIHKSTKVLLFLNRTGTYHTVVCEDCGMLLQMTDAQCTECQSYRIAQRRKGVEELEKEIQNLFPSDQVVRVDGSTGEMDQQELQKAKIVIATEKIFRFVSLDFFDQLCLLSVDHLLLYPHFQSQEKVYQLLQRFFIAGRPVILQTHAPHHPVIQAAVHNKYSDFILSELGMRSLFTLPPIYEQYRLIHKKTGLEEIVSTMPQVIPPDVVVDRL